ncbi:MAG: DoxX family protein [Ferruginibacter sp.]
MDTTLQNQASWTFSRKISFRFFCCLFILYIFPFPVNDIPFNREIDKISEHILGWYTNGMGYVETFWHWLIPVVGRSVVKEPITIFTNGSGDTTYDYLLLLTQTVIALIVSIAWGIADKKRKSYNTAWYWLCVLLRYFVAYMMLGYGFAKVFHLQMPYPYLSRLVQPYGDSSPMGLVWTYVGQSKPFSILVGFSEVICGVLLLFRKTTLVGALLSLVVMGNIVVINFCYDVPVKLFSSVMEIMSFYLTATYWKELYRLFILHQPGMLVKYKQPYFKKKWVRVTVKLLKVLIIADAFFYNITDSIDGSKQYGDSRPRPPLYGIYNSELVTRNNDTIPPLATDTTHWKQVIIQFADYATIKLMNDTTRNYNFKIDTITKTAIIYPSWDTLHKTTFKYIADTSTLILTGKMKDDSIYMRFRRYDINKFRLMNRGFHWINEYPYNR